MKKTPFTLIGLATLLLSCGGGGGSSLPDVPSYELSAPSATAPVAYSGVMSTGVNYQIFVCSFADSNGDGIGDFKGIEQHLDYLKKLGVSNIWLTPIHPSTTYHKYNVRNYYEVDSSFGTMADFESLVAKAKEQGIGVILDMVFNHSGADNPWFAQALDDFASENTDEGSLASLYSLSFDPKDISPNAYSTRTVSGRTVYYECNFDTQMPEFNLDSEVTRAKHRDIMDFWLNKGVAGFRFDGVAYFYKGKDEKCMDYCAYLARTAKELRANVDLIGEYMVSSQAFLNKMASTGMTCFNFSTSGTMDSAVTAVQRGNGYDYAYMVELAQTKFMANSNGTILPAFFLSNHDQDRWVGSRTAEVARACAAQNILTPGTPYLYYGEEIMMRGVRQAASTDANRRLPMQWLSDASADTARPRVLSEADYSGEQTKLGALEEIDKDDSITGIYRQLINFRNAHPELQKGFYKNCADDECPLTAFHIDYDGKEYYLIHNVDENQIAVKVGEGYTLASGLYEKDVSYAGGKLFLAPYTSALLSKN